MNTQALRVSPFDRLIRGLLAARYFSFSLLLHLALLVIVGSLVWFKHIEAAPDFVSGNEGLLMEPESNPAPPADLPVTPPEIHVTTPTLPTAAPLTALVTVAQSSTWTATAQNLPVTGMSDVTKSALASLQGKLTSSGAGGMTGKIGGTRTAMIFGRKIMATKLGVILDVSGSAHPHLAGAVTEIQTGFADAILILYPGCGLNNAEGKGAHQIRKFSSLTKQDLEPDPPYFTTAAQLLDALRIDEFAEMTRRPSVKETLFVSWYAGVGSGSKTEGKFEKLIGQTQVAFEDLLKRNVDTIYWFSDFLDDVEPKMAERITNQLKARRVKLHLHNFAGEKINPLVVEMAVKTGGTISPDDAN